MTSRLRAKSKAFSIVTLIMAKPSALLCKFNITIHIFYSFLDILIFYFLSVSYACVCMSDVCAKALMPGGLQGGRSHLLPKDWSDDSCEIQCDCWESNPGLL